mmetsp:Transcript_14865/g.21270  ORF Transcript_14865/g.21270 Transcript_14865/m.21270 type:complete len:226 (+) Transcript_14865:101-778(+)|eukprot:CAMPEP_0184859416 /NCGR_PEP_ID=MMETSP0580-20130426/4419_1 /TAXON_ID=1118495 /ORGANISM="Dactyliosolen fragilissimus" /LENGTH=225 /DNA_ID=CAMNT_0027356037 /DNA_START=26 /DNA_END=703 /DNA_ORIENTATION=+
MFSITLVSVLSTLFTLEVLSFAPKAATNNWNVLKRRESFSTTITTTATTNTQLDAVPTIPGMWNSGLNFGKGRFTKYKSFDDWMSPFPQEDVEAFPDLFNLPKGVYEVNLIKPLGVILEEIEAGKGVVVTDLVEGGNADLDGRVKVGDILVGVTAIKVVGAKWERRLIPARDLDFDTVVGAIGSNEERWGCTDVVLMFQNGEADDMEVRKFMDFFNPPGDSPWRM